MNNSLNEGSSVHEGLIGAGVVEIGVVPHGPDDFLGPGGATLWVRHQQHVSAPPLVTQRMSLLSTDFTEA